MDVDSACSSLVSEIDTLVHGQSEILLNQLKHISRVLKNIFQDRVSKIDVAVVKNLLGMYLVLINIYARQYTQVKLIQHLAIQKAFRTLMFVLDSLIHKNESVVELLLSWIETSIQSNEIQEFIVNELLRIFRHIIHKIQDVNVNKLLAKQQKLLQGLSDIIQTTCNIETQALIIEIVFKIAHHSSGSSLLGPFSYVKYFFEYFSLEEDDLYPNIRIILDEVNTDMKRIFSVPCTTIEVDCVHVLEFKGAPAGNDIWLDFNLEQKKFSFFCCKEFIDNFFENSFKTSTTWEVVSFDCISVKPVFTYNESTDRLKISFKLNSSAINIFNTTTFGKILNFEINISRNIQHWDQLIDVVLPNFFPESFDKTSLAIPLREESGSGNSSPIIEHISLHRENTSRDEIPSTDVDFAKASVKKISRNMENITRSGARIGSVSPEVKISTRDEIPQTRVNSNDDVDVIVRKISGNVKNNNSSGGIGTVPPEVVEISRKKGRSLTIDLSDESSSSFIITISDDSECDENRTVQVTKKSQSVVLPQLEKISSFPTRVSESGFSRGETSENVVNDAKVSTSRHDRQLFNESISPFSFSGSVFARSIKSSKTSGSFDNIRNALKISTYKKNTDEQRHVSVPISNDRKKLQPKPLIVEELDETAINSSTIKVKEWMEKTLDFRVPVRLPLLEVIPEVPQEDPIQIPSQISERSSQLPIERRLEKLMPDETDTVTKTSNEIANCSHTVEDLLDILEEEPEKIEEDDVTTNQKITIDLDTSDEESNKPLAVLRRKIQKNKDEKAQSHPESHEDTQESLEVEIIFKQTETHPVSQQPSRDKESKLIDEIVESPKNNDSRNDSVESKNKKSSMNIFEPRKDSIENKNITSIHKTGKDSKKTKDSLIEPLGDEHYVETQNKRRVTKTNDSLNAHIENEKKKSNLKDRDTDVSKNISDFLKEKIMDGVNVTESLNYPKNFEKDIKKKEKKTTDEMDVFETLKTNIDIKKLNRLPESSNGDKKSERTNMDATECVEDPSDEPRKIVENLNKMDKGISNENENLDATVISHPSSKRLQRKLYNPKDVSYLNESLTFDYLKSKEPKNKIIASPYVNSKVKKTPKKTKPNRINKGRKRPKKLNLDYSMKLSIGDIMGGARIQTNNNTNTNPKFTFQKIFNDLKEKCKTKRKKSTKKKNVDTSDESSSSMEPFGESVKKMCNAKRKYDTTVDDKFAKRSKSCDKPSTLKKDDHFEYPPDLPLDTKQSESNDKPSTSRKPPDSPKIIIHSNELIKHSCCQTCFDIHVESFYKYLQHLATSDPNLVNNNECCHKIKKLLDELI